MRVARPTSALAVIFAVSMLAACGGGGGGSATPNVPGTGNTPGGPPPTSSSPSSSPSPGVTPTPVQTPTATPTPTPTPTPVASATPNRTLAVSVGHGEINGDDTQFTDGVSAAHETSDGDYPNGGHGPLNTTIGPDNVPCLSAMFNGPVVGQPGGTGYHVHPFLGIIDVSQVPIASNDSKVKGEIALSDGIGFADPLGDASFQAQPTASPSPPPIPNWTNYATTCYYEMHTHDASGVIHVESATPPANGQSGTLFTLGDFLAVWGISYGPNNWGPLNGTVSIYWSGPMARSHIGEIGSNTYTLYCGTGGASCDQNTIASLPLYSHQVIWVLVGPGNPTGSALPNVAFDTEF